MDTYHLQFGLHIRRLRTDRLLTQEEVAHRAMLHVTYVSGIERGVRKPVPKEHQSHRGGARGSGPGTVLVRVVPGAVTARKSADVDMVTV